VARVHAALPEGDSVAMAKAVKTMMLFSNGSIAAFDEQGNQIPELQSKSAIELWAEFALRNGWGVSGCAFTTQRPGKIRGSGVIVDTIDGPVEQWGGCDMV